MKLYTQHKEKKWVIKYYVVLCYSLANVTLSLVRSVHVMIHQLINLHVNREQVRRMVVPWSMVFLSKHLSKLKVSQILSFHKQDSIHQTSTGITVRNAIMIKSITMQYYAITFVLDVDNLMSNILYSMGIGV